MVLKGSRSEPALVFIARCICARIAQRAGPNCTDDRQTDTLKDYSFATVAAMCLTAAQSPTTHAHWNLQEIQPATVHAEETMKTGMKPQAAPTIAFLKETLDILS